MKVTERRTAADFAACMREIADIHFPEAGQIRVVFGNLSTHCPTDLHSYSAFITSVETDQVTLTIKAFFIVFPIISIT